MKKTQSANHRTLYFCRRSFFEILISKVTIFFIIACVAGTCPSLAEEDPTELNVASLYKELDGLYNIYSNEKEPEYDDGRLFSAFLSMKCDTINYSLAKIERLKAEEEQKMKDLDLDFHFGYTDSATYGDDYDYKDKYDSARVGIGWNLLNDGFFAQRKLAREAALKRSIEELSNSRLLELYPCRDAMMTYWFGEKRKTLLRQRNELLKLYIEVLRSMYLRGYVFIDDFLKSEHDLDKNNLTIENLEKQESIIIDKNYLLPKDIPVPFIGIDIEKIIRKFNQNGNVEKIIQAEDAISSLKNSIFNSWNVKVYLDIIKNNIILNKNENEYDTRFGIYFKLPLSVYDGGNLAAEKKETFNKYSRKKSDLLLDITSKYIFFYEKLYSAALVNSRKEIILEKLRRNFIILNRYAMYISNNDGGLTSIAKQIIELQDENFKMLDVKEGLYRSLLYMFTQAGLEFNASYLKKSDVTSRLNRARTGERWLYIWSKQFNEFSNELIFSFLKAKGIKNVLLSAGIKSSEEKLSDFVASSKEKDVHVELMVSNNNWIFPDRNETVVKEAKRLWKMSPYLHLDVEPHVLKGFKSSPFLYWQQYLSMIKSLSEIKNSEFRLSVSLPISVPQEILVEIAPLVDMIHIMAYERTNLLSIQRGISVFKQVKTDKLSLALRPKDFKDEYVMEYFIDKLYNTIGIKNFSIHDMEQYQEIGIKTTE